VTQSISKVKNWEGNSSYCPILFYGDDVDDFDLVKSEVLSWNRCLDG